VGGEALAKVPQRDHERLVVVTGQRRERRVALHRR
jgi:hypothetical protein